MTPARRRWLPAALLGLLVAAGCVVDRPPSPAAADTPCTVAPIEPSERLVLVSEANAARAAGRKDIADFVLSAQGPSAVRLRLSSVGCHCYQVLHAGQSLRVGDEISMAANETTRLQIAAEPATEPGVRQYHAELVGTRRDGTAFSLSLSQSIRTLADIVVRPDVVQIDLDGASSSGTDGVPVQIQQILRARDPVEIEATWEGIPDGMTATPPVLIEPGSPIGDGLWRVHRQATVAVEPGHVAGPGSDRLSSLSVASRRSGVEIARTECVLVARRRSGIAAPSLIHLGRVAPGTSVSRRVQLRALDSVPFAVLSTASRDGTVDTVVVSETPALEHWIEIRTTGLSASIRDELTIATDHPATPILRLPVLTMGGGSVRTSEAGH